MIVNPISDVVPVCELQRLNTMEQIEKAEENLSRDAFLSLYAQGERDFHDVHLDGMDLSGRVLSGINLSGASLVGVNFSGSDLREANLSRADMTQAVLSRANLEGSDLSWAKLSRADMSGVNFHRIQARAANFSKGLLIRARLNDSDCLGANFSGVNATAAQFESANLECADLSRATLMNSNLCGINGSWANFSDARLNWAILSWCLLEAADMENANLTGANLQGANLSFANMNEVILTGSDMYFTTVSGTLLPREQLPARVSSARLSSQTYIRSGWSRYFLREWQRKGAIIVDFEALSREVQAFIREGDCNLRIFFSIPVEEQDRLGIEALINHVMHGGNSLRILSVANEKKGGQIAFYSNNPSDIEQFVTALREHCWQTEAEAFDKNYEAYQTTTHSAMQDVASVLNRLADNIFHIQALIPVDENDKTSRFHARLAPEEKKCAQKTPVSWSSISLPCVKPNL